MDVREYIQTCGGDRAAVIFPHLPHHPFFLQLTPLAGCHPSELHTARVPGRPYLIDRLSKPRRPHPAGHTAGGGPGQRKA
eukprot:144079-Chlamydomonas_euryale.AAC.2